MGSSSAVLTAHDVALATVRCCEVPRTAPWPLICIASSGAHAALSRMDRRGPGARPHRAPAGGVQAPCTVPRSGGRHDGIACKRAGGGLQKRVSPGGFK